MQNIDEGLHEELMQAVALAAFDPSFEYLKRAAMEKIFMCSFRKALQPRKYLGSRNNRRKD